MIRIVKFFVQVMQLVSEILTLKDEIRHLHGLAHSRIYTSAFIFLQKEMNIWRIYTKRLNWKKKQLLCLPICSCSWYFYKQDLIIKVLLGFPKKIYSQKCQLDTSNKKLLLRISLRKINMQADLEVVILLCCHEAIIKEKNVLRDKNREN